MKRASSNTLPGNAPLEPFEETTYRLFARWKDGEEGALEQLCVRYEKALRKFFHLRLPRGARSVLETSDLVQDTLAKTVQQLEGFRYSRPHALGRYFFSAARHRLCSERRRAGRRPGFKSLSVETEDARPSPLEDMVGKERLRLYEEALASLRGKDQDLIFHRVELGLSFGQVATSLEMNSADAARVATGRAIRRLAETIRRLAGERGTQL